MPTFSPPQNLVLTSLLAAAAAGWVLAAAVVRILAGPLAAVVHAGIQALADLPALVQVLAGSWFFWSSPGHCSLGWKVRR